MKIPPLRHLVPTPRRRQEASAVIVVILLLAIVFIYIGANLRTLHLLSRELRLIERQQVRRLQALSVKLETTSTWTPPLASPSSTSR